MRLITSISRSDGARQLPRATLPWAELEAEAARQGCSVADVLFDRAGRPAPNLSADIEATQLAAEPIAARLLRRAFGLLPRRDRLTGPSRQSSCSRHASDRSLRPSKRRLAR